MVVRGCLCFTISNDKFWWQRVVDIDWNSRAGAIHQDNSRTCIQCTVGAASTLKKVNVVINGSLVDPGRDDLCSGNAAISCKMLKETYGLGYSAFQAKF